MDSRAPYEPSLELLAALGEFDLLRKKIPLLKQSESQAELGRALVITIDKTYYQKETVTALLAAGADVTQVHPTKDIGCLHAAIDNASTKPQTVNIIDLLLQHPACLGVKCSSKDDKTLVPPLVYAIKRTEAKWNLVEHIARDIKQPLTEDEKIKAEVGKVLSIAIHEERIETVRLLIKLKPVQPWTIAGNYHLHLAVKNNDLLMVDLLLQNGFEDNVVNSDNLTPLELACSLEQWNCAHKFFTYHPQFKFKNSTQGHGALLKTVNAKQAILAEKLIQAGAKIEEADKLSNRSTCLHLAAANNDKMMIEVLIKNHAQAIALYKGKTAVELACEKGSSEAARQLINSQSGKDPDATLLHYHEALLFAIQEEITGLLNYC